jgi:hypothetical protein
MQIPTACTLGTSSVLSHPKLSKAYLDQLMMEKIFETKFAQQEREYEKM